MDIMIYIGVWLGILGAALAAFNKNGSANFVWIFSSFLLAYRAWGLNDADSLKLFVVYEVFAIYGVARCIRERYKVKSLDGSIN